MVLGDGKKEQIGEFPKIRGTLFGGPHNKDYRILVSILGSPHFGKLPYRLRRRTVGRCFGLYAESV